MSPAGYRLFSRLTRRPTDTKHLGEQWRQRLGAGIGVMTIDMTEKVTPPCTVEGLGGAEQQDMPCRLFRPVRMRMQPLAAGTNG
ncbi:hypothetical protein GCM10011505_22710 [Tistrella bauzanensis]|uniref:Uncharacterized protein n=1 Tax=Tistrella bauzanensis TaxID=657419 RepID=A0ABQ1IHJ8_9PROT|nr:hypothetical protein GCM10011505_22710 [Tistrella bauzanensis]